MNRELYRTTDFYLACFLKCSGYDLVDLQKRGSRVEFIFAEKPGIKRMILDFYNNMGTVAPLAMVDSIKSMKALMYAV